MLKSYYTASFARPFCRRRRITLRPEVVAWRSKKPWVRARFRLCGLYVNDIVRGLLHKFI